MLAYVQRRIDEGAATIPEDEILAAVVPLDHQEYRLRPAYRYGLMRLRRRHLLGAFEGRDGVMRYYISGFPHEDYEFHTRLEPPGDS
jgi:hypothetical protein